VAIAKILPASSSRRNSATLPPIGQASDGSQEFTDQAGSSHLRTRSQSSTSSVTSLSSATPSSQDLMTSQMGSYPPDHGQQRDLLSSGGTKAAPPHVDLPKHVRRAMI
jgi:hypothetical protein